jgi:hypothetical protein
MFACTNSTSLIARIIPKTIVSLSPRPWNAPAVVDSSFSETSKERGCSWMFSRKVHPEMVEGKKA